MVSYEMKTENINPMNLHSIQMKKQKKERKKEENNHFLIKITLPFSTCTVTLLTLALDGLHW